MRLLQGMQRLCMPIVFLTVMCAPGLLLAQEDSVPEEPTLIVRITPSEAHLQEEIVQVIRVIAPHPFEELVLDLPPVENAEMITLQKPKNRKFETYGGEGYIYETRRSIFPDTSGELRIPPVRISGSIGISRNEKKPFALRGEATVLNVRPPPGVFSDDWWLVARDVKIDQSWSQPLETLRVGDRVTRSIVVTVTGATGEHLPEIEQGRSTGLTVLPGQTMRNTKITPDGVIGKIERSFDMRVDVDRPINISPVRVVWWNTETEMEQRSAAPAARLEPLPRDVEGLVSDLMAEAAAARSSSRTSIVALALSVALLVTGLAFWLFQARRRVRPEDRRLYRELNEEFGAIDAVRALRSWSRSAFPNEPLMTLDDIGRRLGPKAEERVQRLQEAAFGLPKGAVDASALAQEIVGIAQEARRRTLTDLVSSMLDHLLGASKRLPEIDGLPSEKPR